MQTLGFVAELRRYPVKSMAAEPLQSATVSWNGIAGDRRWAFIRPGAERSGFPWLTIREKPDLWRYRAYFTDPSDVESSKTLVRTPEDVEFDVTDPELACRLGEGVRVIKMDRGVFDAFPLSLLTVQSAQALSNLVGGTITPLRFRPNIVVNATDSEAFQEEQWGGAILRIGGIRCRLDKRDKRCMMVNIDPADPASTNPAVLRTIAKERKTYLGMYGTTVEPGDVSVGDAVVLEI
jgi:uncharacterized protein YcbX